MFFSRKSNIHVPRTLVEMTFEDKPGACPKCGGRLRQERQSYVVGNEVGSKLKDTVVLGNEMGWFCRGCPTLVLDLNELHETIRASRPDWEVGDNLIVIGVVDWEAAKRKGPGQPPVIPLTKDRPRSQSSNGFSKNTEKVRHRDKRDQRNKRKQEKQNRKKGRK